MKQTTSSSRNINMAKRRRFCEQSRETSTSIDLCVTALSQEEEVTITGDGIVDELQKNPLIAAHVRTIQHLSRIVFGEKSVLDEKIKGILEDSSEGHKILYKLLLNPQSLHKFAGVSVCGFKNRARKNAIQNFDPLCDAINDLVKTLERQQDLMIAQIGQSSREQPIVGTQGVESLLKSFNYFRKKDGSLASNDISEIFKKNPFIQRCIGDIQYWCTRVYGRPNILNKELTDLQTKPGAIYPLLDKIIGEPQSIHSFAGIEVCGIKNKARREAEASVQDLCDSVQFFDDVVKSAKKLMIAEYLESQKQTDRAQNQTPESSAQNILHTRAEHHPTSQQEHPRRARSERVAFAL